MKKGMTSLTVLLICMILVFSTTGLYATSVSIGQSHMDWTSQSITGNLTWTTKYSSSYADAQYDNGPYVYDEQYEPEWTYTSAAALTPKATGNAYTGTNDLPADVYAIADAAALWAYSDATATREVYFTANSSGFATFSIDYELFRDVSTNYAGDLAQSGTTVKLSLWHRNENVWVYDNIAIEDTVTDGDSLTVSDDGTATVTYWFDAGELGYFQAQAYSYTWVETVPEPATVCLLGLGSLALIRRKKTNKKHK